MPRTIRKVAVVGAGIMGSRIACHFANTGVDVLLLNRASGTIDKNENGAGVDYSNPDLETTRTGMLLEKTINKEPYPLYKKEFASRIKTGTLENDISLIKECDWIIEAVIENADVKNNIFNLVEKYRSKGSLVTTNTSGITIHSLSEGRESDFQKNFCGTHFFNPPRYLRLLEIVPTELTDPGVIEFLKYYCNYFLGKNIIICGDRPGFLANRIGLFGFLNTIKVMVDLGFGVDEADKLTGVVAGRPKSATFRTSDLVGLDTFISLAENLFQNLEVNEGNQNFKLPLIIYELEKRRWLGDKTQQGFYKKIRKQNGRPEILTLDLNDFKYKPRKKVKFKTLKIARAIDNGKDRLKALYNGKDKAGEFYRRTFVELFDYVSNLIPGTTGDIYKIDIAVTSGFGWDLGPFETCDVIGLDKVLNDLSFFGKKPAPWISEMKMKGNKSFYILGKGIKKIYNPSGNSYIPIPGKEGFLILDDKRNDSLVWKSHGCSLIDLGDGILDVEFHSKLNIMGPDVIEGINKGIEIAEKDYRGMVIGNNSKNFSAGINLGILFMMAIEQNYHEIDLAIRLLQNTIMRIRYSSIPVVIAPHDLTLGGGCEMTIHADGVQASAETYIGLVEVRVGLLPGGGGTKEMTKRVSEDHNNAGDGKDKLQNIFMNIATGRVSTSAWEAKDLCYLNSSNEITIHSDRLLADAKSMAIRLSESGYKMPDQDQKIKVQGKPGMGQFLNWIEELKINNNFSDYDVKIAKKIAGIMCGGELPSATLVTEQYLLDLEREAFLSLCTERKTLERIEAILQGRKPLRN